MGSRALSGGRRWAKQHQAVSCGGALSQLESQVTECGSRGSCGYQTALLPQSNPWHSALTDGSVVSTVTSVALTNAD